MAAMLVVHVVVTVRVGAIVGLGVMVMSAAGTVGVIMRMIMRVHGWAGGDRERRLRRSVAGLQRPEEPAALVP
ncbi:hypothetical protein NK983_29750, partial [Salmonella enterica subsp. enterica serovar Typhimurium]|nr:hypothetical protein [Salmonella enterica subsp. enterica serovar Typhimurium]